MDRVLRKEFEMKVAVRQGSVLCPLLRPKTWCCQQRVRTGKPEKSRNWKDWTEAKDLRFNAE